MVFKISDLGLMSVLPKKLGMVLPLVPHHKLSSPGQLTEVLAGQSQDATANSTSLGGSLIGTMTV